MTQVGQLIAGELPLVIEAEALEGQRWPIRARLENRLQVALVQANVTAASLTVYEDGSPSAPILVAPLVVADVIFNTLQTGLDWQQDGKGYNLAVDVDPDLWGGVKGGRAYVAKIVATTNVAGLGPKTVMARVLVRGVPE